jgi:hypothetical protein
MHPVTVEGFLARIEPGTRFELEKVPVEDGIWLAKHFAMRSRARVLFFAPLKEHEDVTYSDYQRQNLPMGSSQTRPSSSRMAGREF